MLNTNFKFHFELKDEYTKRCLQIEGGLTVSIDYTLHFCARLTLTVKPPYICKQRFVYSSFNCR